MEKEIIESIILKHVHIEGIWGKYTVDFPLDRDVNILVGDNGVGKTTILNIIAQICSNRFDIGERITKSYRSARIEFSDGYETIVETTEADEKNAKWFKSGKDIEYKDVYSFLDIVSTFDSSIFPESVESKIKATHSDVESELDIMAYQEIDLLYKYVSMISKISRELSQKGERILADEIYSQYDKMKFICNKLFEGKTWFEADDGTIMFRLNEDNNIIYIPQLSSGEKQMLILLISTLIQNGRNYITFWDEPEVSLHIGWQQQLIRVMRELNPNMQLIIATHSPSILHEGWEQRAINVNDIKSKQK